MDSNAGIWFFGGVVAGIISGFVVKAAYNFIWTYYEDLQKLNLSIVDVRRELGQYMRENDHRCSDNFKYLYDKIEDLKNRVTVPKPKKIK